MCGAPKLLALAATAFLLTSCGPGSPEDRYVLEKIPVQLQKTITVEMRELTGFGPHAVGIRCTPEVWNVLTNSPQSITVRLKSASMEGTHVSEVDPNIRGSLCDAIPGTHYIFTIGGKGRAVVEIEFPNLPSETSQAEIIVSEPQGNSL